MTVLAPVVFVIGTIAHGVNSSVELAWYRSWYATKVELAVWLNPTVMVLPLAVPLVNDGAALALSADRCGGVQCGWL